MLITIIVLAATVLFLCVFALGIYLFRGRILLANRLLQVLSLFVLFVPVGQYAYSAATGNPMHFPIEFSTLSCIVFGLVVLFDKKKVAYPFAAFAAFLSGVGFNFLLFIGRETFIGMRESNLWLLTNIFLHDALLLGSLLMMGNFKFTHKTVWQIPLGCAVFVGWAFLGRYAIGRTGNVYTLRILEATIFDNVWNTERPEVLASAAFLPAYYVVLALVLVLSVVLVLGLNKLIYKHDRLDAYYIDEEEY